MKKLLPVILGLIGLAGGVAGGHALKPAPPPEPAMAEAGAVDKTAMAKADSAPAKPDEAWDYVKINNQFVVPIVEDERVAALIVVSLSIETEPGVRAAVYKREPKLRDEFLQTLFRHAHSGGFSGVFTAGQRMADLRGSLREAARKVLGPVARDVLVTEIIRQDL